MSNYNSINRYLCTFEALRIMTTLQQFLILIQKFGHLSEMDLKDSYKSILHYLILQPNHSGTSLGSSLFYFTNKDINKLHLALSETHLRDAFYQSLGSFYNKNTITCVSELNSIINHSVVLEKCNAPRVSIGKSRYNFEFFFNK